MDFNASHAIWKFFQQNLATSTDVTSLEETNQVQVSMYPNPVSKGNSLYVVSDKKINEITIADIQGRVINHSIINSLSDNISTSGIDTGVYFVKFLSIICRHEKNND